MMGGIISSMYGTVIEVKSDIASDVLSQLQYIIENAFSNRAGSVMNISKEAHRFEFIGGEKDYGCLEVGLLKLKRDTFFLDYVQMWKWIDVNPDECCDVLEIFSTVVR